LLPAGLIAVWTALRSRVLRLEPEQHTAKDGGVGERVGAGNPDLRDAIAAAALD
jgi:hypothetical protein